jgi:hypothetical protein
MLVPKEARMAEAPMETTLGELVAAVYETLLEEYGDPELASVATSAIVSDMLSQPLPRRGDLRAA